MLDVFNQDAFSMVSLTAAIQKLPFVPSRLGQLGIFQEEGVPTTTVMIDEENGKLAIVPTAARGTMPNTWSGPSRKARNFRVPHIPLNAFVMAEDVQGVRKFGSEDQTEGVAEVINAKMQAMKQALEVTKEYHRVGAIKGVVLDADGTTPIYDLFSEFNLTQTVRDIDFSSDTTDVKDFAIGTKRVVEAALGGTTYRYLHVMCGDAFFDSLVAHPNVKTAFDRYQESAFYRDDQRGGFEYPRGVIWENYTGGVGDSPFFATDEAYCFPVGVPDLFITRYAPADFMETVNTIGQSVYAKQVPMKFDVGTELHVQTNPLVICTRPKVLIKFTCTTDDPGS